MKVMTLQERRRASSEARNEALRRLKAAHADEYRDLYEEEALARGITPASLLRDRRIAWLEAELLRLRGGSDED